MGNDLVETPVKQNQEYKRFKITLSVGLQNDMISFKITII